MKTCHVCRLTKPADDFPVWGASRDGGQLRRSRCSTCYALSRGRTPGALGRPRGTDTADRIADLLSIDCEWWTVERIASRLSCSERTVERHVGGLVDSGRLRRRQRPQTGAWEYQSDPHWAEIVA